LSAVPGPVLDREAVAACCGSRRWQELMLASGAAGAAAVQAAAERAFGGLARADWLEAFAAHSEIGAPRAGDTRGAGEQAGIDGADATLRSALAAANIEYQTRFGFVFLIRARDRSAAEILSALHARLSRPPEAEFQAACAEQREITALRLAELLR
jgi:2-oxo-4-hydroxy-4-carboxy-5-ureidoimidazoline decarboxylase